MGKVRKIKKDLTETYINKMIRSRDMVNGFGKCCSCGAITANIDAGHYIAVGASSYLRYCPLNIHAQCHSCNRFGGGGKATGYGAFVVRTYGSGLVLALDDMRTAPGFGELDKKEMRKMSLQQITEKFYGALLGRWRTLAPHEAKVWEKRAKERV